MSYASGNGTFFLTDALERAGSGKFPAFWGNCCDGTQWGLAVMLADERESGATEVRRKVAVIVPAYNAEASLGDCLNSVMSQSFFPSQVIVVDDGSKDGTRMVARSFGDRVTCLEQDNQGQGAARNLGIAHVDADYLAFLDADDYWLPSFLERGVEFLDRHPEAIAVSTAFVVRAADGREVVRPEAVNVPHELSGPRVLGDFFGFWAAQDHVRTGTVLIRKAVVDGAGPQRADLRISQDLEYWGYLATFGAWGFIPEPLWVGNSRAAAATGWLTKYRARRRLCPTVESWEQRIVPRLEPHQWPSFRIVRGRVAANFAHSKILGGAPDEALEIVRKYGDEMPANRLTKLLKSAARAGGGAWRAACLVVHAKELSKVGMMQLGARFSA